MGLHSAAASLNINKFDVYCSHNGHECNKEVRFLYSVWVRQSVNDTIWTQAISVLLGLLMHTGGGTERHVLEIVL